MLSFLTCYVSQWSFIANFKFLQVSYLNFPSGIKYASSAIFWKTATENLLRKLLKCMNENVPFTYMTHVIQLSKELSPILTVRGASYRKSTGRIYSACVQYIVLTIMEQEYVGNDRLMTLIKSGNCSSQRMMVRWMCGVVLEKTEMRSKWFMQPSCSINCVADVVRRFEDWDGQLDIWSVRVPGWLGCLLPLQIKLVVEGTRGRGRSRKLMGYSVLGMTWNCLVCILSGLIFRDMWRDLIWGQTSNPSLAWKNGRFKNGMMMMMMMNVPFLSQITTWSHNFRI